MHAHWTVCQLGAREHYSVAAALHASGCLNGLFTDAWIAPETARRLSGLSMGRRLADRYCHDLASAEVGHANFQSILFELGLRLQRRGGWEAIIARNDWFQRRAIKWLTSRPQIRLASESGPSVKSERQPILFAYSYAALSLFRWAKSQGWMTVLGQIDGGFQDERLISQLRAEQNFEDNPWRPAPSQYWDQWHDECKLADRVVVNSNWSQSLVAQSGVAPQKLAVIPLAYSPPPASTAFVRDFAPRFSARRPLKVLFLGQVTVRKGILELLKAAEELLQQPVEFSVVGSHPQLIPEQWSRIPNVRFIGPIPRSETNKWYRNSDIFLFPTHSDGFGLTQLEAQAWKLPVVASRCCGDVIEDGINGRRLDFNSSNAIVEAIEAILEQPHLLRQWSEQSCQTDTYSTNRMSHALSELL
ncbi:glycosyltransferase family 4 protein [Allorhodopirellula heiligendammensis]|uniref:D-inositol 3-phosphate glycosyltransferase n=1 Tax=Allorhodopirellula heiligendammensis TaxID=2714739 RepID=A0A5C6BXE6_9BACT|nr:glycosyltransferase family 4 protein [Allorhodopirellula heiligendammensis]TWU16990.1 D-inositol 3-phosphate glycosyltransferase [Allorhodopirellula heiligendammensis]